MKYSINILVDNCAINPREGVDNGGTFVGFHKRFTIGDIQVQEPIATLEGILKCKPKGVYNLARLKELLALLQKKEIAQIVYMYDHSGQSFSTEPFSCPWDSGIVGFIYTSKELARADFKVKRVSQSLKDTILESLTEEIEVYNSYWNGENYYFEILDEEGDIIDSCSGFVGTDWNANGLIDNLPLELLNIDKDEALKLVEEAYKNIKY